MAQDLHDAANKIIFDRNEMATIELILGMGHGYVLDFSDRTFNEFVRRHWNLDATAPTYIELGTSKANRLRGLLRAFNDQARADVLQKFLDYRNHPTRADDFESVNPDVEKSYVDIIQRLIGNEDVTDSAGWTGRPSLQARVAAIKVIAPIALGELKNLIDSVEARRFNDPETADALRHLKELHGAIGQLIEAIEDGRPIATIVSSIELHRSQLLDSAERGAKIFVVAPALALGVAHLLCWISGTTIDSGMMSTVYASLVGADALSGVGREMKRRAK
ncbi:hypothetical protein PQ455_06735 [Sphingomonas naphthae]|uniref:DUF3944 domain-containing protein n=1 Tax=Sphingomonas naphthae TaxID=1813468 RepID=A0ABY7TP89_9SPHN|nr:hypothetical protein [Sphingomonas naphthae]WCT74908.1 hypothetical protein PQ455_06735 [Sphingomonas naphthae]